MERKHVYVHVHVLEYIVRKQSTKKLIVQHNNRLKD